MTKPTNFTPEGRAYLALQKLAKEQQRPTDELLQLYVLERFLARLSESAFAEQFVLKGGVLLAAFDSRRPTKDIDFAARDFANDLENVIALIAQVAVIEMDDGVVFKTDSITAETIRDDHFYSGARISLNASLSRAQISFHIDVNFGDPIYPQPSLIELPSLLSKPLHVLGYPLEMVLAEKLVTAFERGTTNTRWRDFADIWTLVKRHNFSGEQLTDSIVNVAKHRDVELSSLTEQLEGFAELAQQRWSRWRAKVGLYKETPEMFDEVLSVVCKFADPIFASEVRSMNWDWSISAWQ